MRVKKELIDRCHESDQPDLLYIIQFVQILNWSSSASNRCPLHLYVLYVGKETYNELLI